MKKPLKILFLFVTKIKGRVSFFRPRQFPSSGKPSFSFALRSRVTSLPKFSLVNLFAHGQLSPAILILFILEDLTP